MNPRQRRGVLIMVLAGLTAVVLFFVAVSYVTSVNRRIAPTTTVYQVVEDVEAYSVLEEADLEPVEVPERWTAASAAGRLEEVVGRRVAFNISSGTFLGNDMLLPPSALNEDEREIALTVDAKTGIAGRIQSGDFVDVYAVFGDEPAVGSSRVLVRNVRVVSVRGVETRTQATSGDDLTEQQVVPVTLALQPTEALAVTYADAFAATVRLVGLPPGTSGTNRSDERDQVDADDFDLPSGGE